MRSDTRESSEETYSLGSVFVKSELWTPGTFAHRTETLFQQITDYSAQASLFSMAKESDTGMHDLISMMIKMQADNEKKALEREERRMEDQARWDEQRDRETRQMIAALKDNIPAVPQTVHIENTKLPRMVEGEDAEVFLELFEAALIDNNIPDDKWRGKLHASLDTSTKLRVRDIITNAASSYQDIKDALIGCGTLTFSASSEAIITADKGKILALPIRQAVDKTTRLMEKATSEAANIREACQYLAIAVNRYFLNPEVKQYVDLKGDFAKENFCRTVEEWQSTQAPGTKWSKRVASPYE